jgi:hypothetical protein
MKKRLLLLCVLCTVVLLTACIDTITLISVRKDGSGTITETVYFNESAKTMMQEMMGQFGGEETEGEKEPLDIEKYKTKAAELGKGVKFVAAKEVTNKEGSSGIEVVYAFEDIRTLNIDAEPDNPMGDKMAGMMGAEAVEEEEDKNPFTFDFVKGSTPKLIITIPKEDKDKHSEEEKDETEADPQSSAAGLEMMKPFFEGFRIRVLIKLLDGKVIKTNASFVDNKDTITLMDVAMGEILSNKEFLDKMEDLDKMKDMSAAMEKMKEIPGLKIETAKKVEISFK